MSLHRINEPHARKVKAVIRELLELTQEIDLTSFVFIAKAEGRRRIEGIVGKCTSDPKEAIADLTIMQSKLLRLVPEDFPDTVL